MNKDEYLKILEKYYDDNKLKNTDGYGEGLAETLDYAINLAEKLDEPRRVVIPQFVADGIEKAKIYSDNEVEPCLYDSWGSKFEVIGNVHEKPELLEE